MNSIRGYSSSQTLMILMILMVLQSSCLLVVDSSVEQDVRQIVHNASAALHQAKSTIADVTKNLLHHESASGEGGDDHHEEELEDDDKDKAGFLAAHNKVRLRAREPPFAWDPKLESYARRYAQKRRRDCQLIHSAGPYGENIFWGGGDQWKVEDAVALWVKEHRFYDRGTRTCMQGRKCGHYTQVVWRDSTRLGCARIQCVNGDTFVVCCYDPPGNYIGENPFTNHNR